MPDYLSIFTGGLLSDIQNRYVAKEISALNEKTEEYGRFCRNCRHFIIHPFQSRCGRTGQDADPMGECGQFELRKETK